MQSKDETRFGQRDMASVRWRRPIGAHAKVLVIGGRREGKPDAANRPRQPTAFLKFPTSFAEPDAALMLPRRDGRFEIDAAIGFVIGREASRVSSKDAAGLIFGYVLLADVTDVDAYEEEARTNNGLLAKNHPGLSAISRVIHSRDASAGLPFSVRMKVNGAARQSFSTTDFPWSAEEAIAAWSLPTLVPGDIVALGAAMARTTAPLVAISPGDEIEIESDHLGTIRHTVQSP